MLCFGDTPYDVVRMSQEQLCSLLALGVLVLGAESIHTFVVHQPGVTHQNANALFSGSSNLVEPCCALHGHS